jgi:hypothetical protein
MSGKERIQRAYDRFLQLPRPVILLVMWVVGLVLLGSCVLVIYLYVSALVQMLVRP